MTNFKEIYQTFALKEIIQEPTRITSIISSRLDDILTNSGWKYHKKE